MSDGNVMSNMPANELRLVTTDSHGDLVDLRYCVLLPSDAELVKAMPLVMIMGFNCSMYHWLVNTMPHELAKHRPVVLIDNRGLRTLPDAGKRWSSHMAYSLTKEQRVHFGLELREDLGLHDMADDVKSVLSHAFPQQHRFHVAGVSMGGMIAQHFALRYPELLGSLMLLATTADSQANHVRLAEKIPEMKNRGQPLPIPSATHAPESDEEKKIAAILDVVMTVGYQPGNAYMMVGSRWRSLGDTMAPMRTIMSKYPHSAHAIAIHQRANRKHNSVALFTANHPLITQRIPVLLVAGEEDPLRDIECAKQLNRLIPHARLVTYEGTGHILWMERERELTEELVTWTAQHELAMPFELSTICVS